jgi:hypothetical protein
MRQLSGIYGRSGEVEMPGQALDAVNGECAAQASGRRKSIACYNVGALTMKIFATLPVNGRDLRLDLFHGVANWGLFLDHIPNNIVN